MEFIRVLEARLEKKATLNLLPLQPGDVPMTYADIEELARDVGFSPHTSIQLGVERFVEWYRKYFSV